VLRVDEWVTIKEMARHGVSISEIARRTGRDRNTIRTVLSETVPREHRRAEHPRAKKLDAFREYLLGRIEQGCTNGSVLLEEIVARGYTGKTTMLREFLHPIRQELIRKREATERFETGPGKQAQVDWGEFGRIFDSREDRWKKLHAFLFTLGYSRAGYLEFTTSADMEHFLACHIHAFGSLGIPEVLLYDNLKTGILGRRSDGSPIFPGRFLDFALYYGFTPRFCQPYRPRTKGKVERGIAYVRGNFWVRVAQEVSTGKLELASLNERARAWMDRVANERVHGTHGEIVRDRYVQEEPQLGRVDGRALYDTDYRSIRRVGRDGRLSYRGTLYQVSLAHALSEVEVAESLEGKLTIHSKEGLVLRAHPVEISEGIVRPQVPREERGTQQEDGKLLQVVVVVGQVDVEMRDLSIYEEVAHAAAITR
jgi:Transposase and inactivated derivatives